MQDGPKPEFLQKQVAYYVMNAEKWRYAGYARSGDRGSSVRTISTRSRNATDVLASGSLGSAGAKGKPDQYVYDPRDVSIAAVEVAADPASFDGSAPDPCCARQAARLSHRAVRAGHRDHRLLQAVRVAGDRSARYRLRRAGVTKFLADGSSIFLTNDVKRARYRDSPRTAKLVTTREAQLYDFNGFTFTSRLLRQGSRLRLVIGPVNSIYSPEELQLRRRRSLGVDARCPDSDREALSRSRASERLVRAARSAVALPSVFRPHPRFRGDDGFCCFMASNGHFHRPRLTILQMGLLSPEKDKNGRPGEALENPSQGESKMSELSRVAGAFVLVLGATNVYAAESQNIEEVIVTAQKRAEALIDVPQSVSVVDGRGSGTPAGVELPGLPEDGPRPAAQPEHTGPGPSRHARCEHRRCRFHRGRVRR